MTAEWFANWFNEDYLRLYAHRNVREARSVADLIRARLPALARGRTLDLGCGAGRHLTFLSRTQPAIGLDLSPWLLDAARRRQRAAPLVRADMRSLPFQANTFTLVVNLFTSFGYFLDDAQNAHVLREVARVTAPGGAVVLDFLNAPHVRQTVVPFDRRHVGSEWIQQWREISAGGRFISKTIVMEAAGTVFTERVRLFEPRELAAMLADCGFVVAEMCGDYSGRPLTSTSPRAIMMARRPSRGG